SGKANPQALYYVPKDNVTSLTVALPDAAKLWQKFLALADDVGKANGLTAPSKTLAQMEKGIGVNLGKDVLARIKGVTIAQPAGGPLAKDRARLPMLVLEATDDEAAKELEKILPNVLNLLQPYDLKLPGTAETPLVFAAIVSPDVLEGIDLSKAP